ncbi:MAG: BrnA antitoxin family protein [Ruminococcus sp.]|nr:BrnA antitoxin family protein [Ruminococcus sp.]
MREEYDIKNLNPRKNPYSNKLKKQITINIDSNIIDFFKSQAADTGIPYQTLINLYLADCVKNNKKPTISWT